MHHALQVGGWDLVCWLLSQIEDQSRCYGRWKTTFGGRRPSLEGNLQWKYNLRWKTAFGKGRWPSVEDGLWWKTTYSGRQPSVEDGLRWKTTFVERRPSEDNLRLRTTFSGRRPLLDPCMLPTRFAAFFFSYDCVRYIIEVAFMSKIVFFLYFHF